MWEKAATAAVPNELASDSKVVSFALADKQSGEAARGGRNLGETNVRGNPGAKTPDLAQVTARKNLNETTFFFPQLLSDSSGVVKLQFTMPEALTQWKFMGFAHDAKCRSGFLEGKAVTAKDLMVQPSPPRFLRESDTLEFTVKVSNQSAARQEGKVRLTFNDARTELSVDKLLANVVPEITFDIPAKESRSYAWRIKVPDGCPFLTYKAVASTGKISDGEEGYVPVLSRRIFVTESLPLPIRGKAGGPVTKKFSFEKLLASSKSSSLVHQNLTVQMVSNPSWYAVMALPYLMEFPHECSEQTFNRLYANALARSIAASDPKIHRVFEQWRGTPALDSPLEKNQDLKAVLLEETPWLRQAKDESQARRNVGILFDDNRLNSETTRLLAQLAEMQLPDGLWPWFPGGRGNDYITLYITTGFGRLRHLGVDVSVDAAIRSLDHLDTWMDERYRDIQKRPNPEDYVPGSTDALYLYGRSFFLKDKPVDPAHVRALEFFLGQSRKHWLKVNDRQSQGHLAVALKRFNSFNQFNDATPIDIMRSIKERSVTSEEMGMFWRETELSWWWYRAPIETQALMIEAFDEVMADKQAVEECKVWLLKQKQTQDWKTTKATADAVYALLLRGKDVLASDALVEVTVGGVKLAPGAAPVSNLKSQISNSPEAGTGFYERRFAAADIKPKLGDITVRKTDEGVAWGSVHWQYLEDMSKVTPHEGTPLKLKKSLFTKTNTKKGPTLEPVKGPVQVGDELVVRLELRVDRDMEYVHLKDQRGSGTEPVNVLSRYKYQDGLAYYETTRDTASHFFIDYLPKGIYVFEYSTRVQHRGQYQTGVAEIQCMYAPEFNSHSESLPLVVK
ncbi:MAG: alpha-2-macroglobulin family protein [Verrucomicrobia bacterium]|nr:alpha-2-macroglobulin family protein [Verrucomicrobiota bacterium]